MSFTNFYINGYPAVTVIWNLSLLIVPYFLFRLIYYFKNRNDWPKTLRHGAIALGALFWLLFIPNAAYIVTDVRHLNNYCPAGLNNVCQDNVWLITFFFTYALTGWVAFVYLMNQMKNLVYETAGKTAADYFIILIMPLVSLGVLLGLVERFNSWDVFLSPGRIAASALSYAFDPYRLVNFFVFTFFLYLLYISGNYLFAARLKWTIQK